MDSAALRQWGAAMVDYVADYWENMRKLDPLPNVEPGYIRKVIPVTAPENADRWEQIFSDIEPAVIKGTTHWHHPRFLAYYPTANSYPGVVADILCNGLATIGPTWDDCPASTELEVIVMDWLAKATGLPEEFLNTHSGPGAGIFQSSASDATFVAILAARNKFLKRFASNESAEARAEIFTRLVAYQSNQANSSVERDALLAGVTMRKITTWGPKYAVGGNDLEKAIKDDLAEGLIPFCVVATLGSTGTCAYDNLTEIGPVCQKYNLWLHVDAAYAGAAFVCPEYRDVLQGIEFADSYNFNPHKWLLTNFDCSAMWFRDVTPVKNVFQREQSSADNSAARAKQPATAIPGKMPDLMNFQVPVGRRFRALKLWFVMRAFGLKGLQAHIRNACSNGIEFEKFVRQDKRFDVIAPVTMGLVCFRLKESNDKNERLMKALNEDRRIYIIPANDGHDVYYLRMVVNPTTTREDVIFAWNVIVELTNKL